MPSAASSSSSESSTRSSELGSSSSRNGQKDIELGSLKKKPLFLSGNRAAVANHGQILVGYVENGCFQARR